MSTFISAARAFIADEEGVTALEYGMIAALVAVIIMSAVSGLGEKLKDVFTNIAGAI